MSYILSPVTEFGLPTVAAAVLIFIVIKGEFVFRYPRRSDPSK
jgi:hypothetical protein